MRLPYQFFRGSTYLQTYCSAFPGPFIVPSNFFFQYRVSSVDRKMKLCFAFVLLAVVAANFHAAGNYLHVFFFIDLQNVKSSNTEDHFKLPSFFQGYSSHILTIFLPASWTIF